MGKQPSKADLFIELACPDAQGFSKPVSVDLFVGKYERLKMGNGGDWCRDDGSLAKRFNIKRHKAGNRIVEVSLHGFKKQPIKKPIPARIRNALKDKKCAILGTGKVEIDHKDGRRDDPRLGYASSVKIEDFQPLSKAANNAKRQHCKTCRTTGKRFDASSLGYSIGQVKGNGTYEGSCVGCYWYDPFEFNRLASTKKTE